MTTLEAATLATTDATLPAPPSPPSPLLSSAVPSEPARCCSPRRKAAVPPAPSVPPARPRNFPSTCPACCPGRGPAAVMPRQGRWGSGLVWDGSPGSSRFGLPRGSVSASRRVGGALEDGGDRDILEQEGSVLRGQERHPGCHWSLPPLGPGVVGREEDLASCLLL